jgi:hypothetical protein
MTDVRMPDGTIIRNVPEGTTRTQLMARYGKHQQSGGVLGAIGNVVSSGNELLLGGVEGMYNAASAVTDPLAKGVMNLFSPGSGTQAVAAANQQRRAVVNSAEHTFIPQANPLARNIGRVAGAAALPVPKIAAAGRAARVANRLIQGAVGGAGVREVDEGAAGPATAGALVNAILPPVASAIAKTAPVKAVTRALSFEAAPLVNDLGRQAQARIARFKSLGVDSPTTGMVTRDPAAFSFEQNASKIYGAGDGLAQQMRGVEKGLVDRGRSMVRNLGGAAGPEATGKGISDVLDAKQSEMRALTGRLYDNVRETRGADPVGDLAGLRTLMDDPMVTDNAAFDSMRDSLGRRLSRLGARDAMDDLAGPPVVTVSQAEELRKFIGSLGSSADPATRMMRGKMIDVLDDDVVNAVGGDAFKAARASAKARFGEFSKTFPGKLASEGLAPELLSKRILGDGVRLSDIRSLRQSLTTGTEDQIARGTEAWKALQAQAIDDLMGKSVDADGQLVGSVLSREFAKSSAKLRELLEPQDFKDLRRLAAATHDVKAFPVGHSVNTSNTAPTMANLFSPGEHKHSIPGMLLKRGLAFSAGSVASGTPIGGLVANVGLNAAERAGAMRENQQIAQELMRQVRLAQSPEAAAAAIQQIKQAAAGNPALSDYLNKAGLGRLIGATGAAAAQ